MTKNKVSKRNVYGAFKLLGAVNVFITIFITIFFFFFVGAKQSSLGIGGSVSPAQYSGEIAEAVNEALEALKAAGLENADPWTKAKFLIGKFPYYFSGDSTGCAVFAGMCVGGEFSGSTTTDDITLHGMKLEETNKGKVLEFSTKAEMDAYISSPEGQAVLKQYDKTAFYQRVGAGDFAAQQASSIGHVVLLNTETKETIGNGGSGTYKGGKGGVWQGNIYNSQAGDIPGTTKIQLILRKPGT